MKSTSLIKSPLRYPGGKSRAAKKLFDYVPSGTKTLCSPFFGGGSFEIYCAQNGIQVRGYDVFESLVFFWQELLNSPKKLADKVATYKPGEFSKEQFYNLQKSHPDTTDPFMSAVEFYVLNRTSFSGSTLSGGMANYKGINPRFTESSIERIRNFKVKNIISVEKKDFTKSINLKKHKNDLLYLDPPYLIENNLYGNKGDLQKNFKHDKLLIELKKRESWILSYNDSDVIRSMYEEFQFAEPEWSYGMSKSKKSKEILILSNDLPLPKSKK
ncbi:MAG: DNA adenine methylase [Candidatus Nitrosopelagicus sp.]|jgi:DNA adenine methylase|nr:DNA adenine methylase [Candidatus Nitrosopelagicus sp.]